MTMQLLTASTANPKMHKGAAFPITAAILHLSPADLSGYNACTHCSIGCKHACLNESGRGRMQATQDARKRKTRLFFEYPESFLFMLCNDLDILQRKARKLGTQCAVRLNGTSDILWRSHPVTRNGTRYDDIFAAYPDIQFYDYTKVPAHYMLPELPNYHVTFSLSESNDKHACKALARGLNLAVVMQLDAAESFPATWSGFPVLDGTLHDYRFLDPRGGHIVGLKPKGSKAKHDETGFVRSLDYVLDDSKPVVLAVQKKGA
jgi:hypothetical protein